MTEGKVTKKAPAKAKSEQLIHKPVKLDMDDISTFQSIENVKQAAGVTLNAAMRMHEIRMLELQAEERQFWKALGDKYPHLQNVRVTIQNIGGVPHLVQVVDKPEGV